jgi:proline dehydrogenase
MPVTTAPPGQLDLSDTRTAFAAKSDRDLWQAQQLFRIIGNPLISSVGAALSRVALVLRLPVKGMIKATIFKQFCGGETIEESLATASKLAQSRVGTILDHSVEGQEDEGTFDETVQEVLRTIAVAKRTFPSACSSPQASRGWT